VVELRPSVFTVLVVLALVELVHLLYLLGHGLPPLP